MPRRSDPPVDPGERRERARIQELFHGLIRSRCREGGLPIPRPLPSIMRMPRNDCGGRARWFPVPGMYGGFRYQIELRGQQLVLHAESWCRIAEGSERRHRISDSEIVLVESGFAPMSEPVGEA